VDDVIQNLPMMSYLSLVWKHHRCQKFKKKTKKNSNKRQRRKDLLRTYHEYYRRKT